MNLVIVNFQNQVLVVRGVAIGKVSTHHLALLDDFIVKNAKGQDLYKGRHIHDDGAIFTEIFKIKGEIASAQYVMENFGYGLTADEKREIRRADLILTF